MARWRGGSDTSHARAERGAYTADARRRGRLRVENLQGVELALGELDDICEAMGPGLVELVKTHTEAMHRDAVTRWNATVVLRKTWGQKYGTTYGAKGFRTGTYRDAIRHIFFDEGQTGKVFVGYMGDRPDELPLWLEYGTLHMAPREHLIPALIVAWAKFSSAVERLMGSMPKG